jgi:CheY-like chemotaxis protein
MSGTTMIRAPKTEPRHVKVLLVEDNPGDRFLVRAALARGSWSVFDVLEADRLSEALELLDMTPVDLVLLDLTLPDSWGLATFTRVHATSRNLPVVVLTGLDDEESALGAVRLGAQDYLVKGKCDEELLSRSIHYAIERARLLAQLETAAANIRRLRGLLPICAWCKKVRDDEGYWREFGDYLAEHADVLATHGLCPDCSQKMAPR